MITIQFFMKGGSLTIQTTTNKSTEGKWHQRKQNEGTNI